MEPYLTGLVDRLAEAYGPGDPVPLAHQVAGLGLDAAWDVRREVLRRLCNTRGSRVTAYKVGLTSPEARSSMGASEPVYGELLDEWVLTSPARIGVAELRCGVVEAELAFIIREPLSPRADRQEIIAKSSVAPALDIPDSRYAGWYPLPEMVLVDLVADNCFAGRLVVGDAPVPADSVDLLGASVELRSDDAVVARGRGAAALGDPVAAVVWLSEALARRRLRIEAGDVVSAGAITSQVVGRTGLFEADFGPLGGASVEISGRSS